MQKMIHKEFKRKTGMKIKRREKGQKWGSNANGDPQNFHGGGGENRGGFGPRSPSGSAHEMLSFYAQWSIIIKPR